MKTDHLYINKLEEEYGSPLYVFHESDFRRNYDSFLKAMTGEYDRYVPAYSFKTNYTPYICRLVGELGGYAEVVSLMEYRLARKVGYTPDRIIFNGPDKISEMTEALEQGSIVNADSYDEVISICDFAAAHPDMHIGFGLRVNLDLGQDFVSRFGMDEADIDRSFEYVKHITNADITGLHCHISRCRGIEAWEKRTHIMLGLADRYFTIKPPAYVDLGSGMFGTMEPELAEQFDDIPTYEEYAQVTAKLVDEHYAHCEKDEKPILFTEPGTTLINRFISLIACVDAIKNIRGRRFAVLNCSEHNLGEICTLKRVPVEVIPGKMTSADRDSEITDMVGYTCLEQDVIYTGYKGELMAGDRVVFRNVGGYSNVLKPPFIRPNCAMIAVCDDGSERLIKRTETEDDVFSTYVF